MKRILLAYPKLNALGGGGNALAAWVLDSLKDEYHVTLLAWAPFDFEQVNLFFGTTLHSSDLEIEIIEPWLTRLASKSPTPMALLKDYYLSYRCRRMADRFDAVVWLHNEADLGVPGIQYIHYPRLLRDRPEVDLRWWHQVLEPAVRAYYAISAWLTGFSAGRMRQNLTLVNSHFIGQRVRKLHGIEPVVLYPPAIGRFRDVAWEDRKNGFVSIGRVSREKRIETVIDILSSVHRVEPSIHLHLIAAHQDADYLASTRKLVRANEAWITLHENIPRREVTELIVANRYGIHGMRDEHFGMAVAELVTGGCITFVHNSGGPVEIVGGNERLVYNSPGDAVEKILRAIREPETQSSLRGYIGSRKELFGTERFSKQIREVVARFLLEAPKRAFNPLPSRPLSPVTASPAPNAAASPPRLPSVETRPRSE